MRTKILATTTVAAALILTACGGGDSAPASSGNTLSGTAAVGVPIIGGNVSVTCAGGSPLATTTASNGAWQVTTSGQLLPCAVQVSGGTVGGSANATPYHSIAMSFGTVNITPLTDLVVARLAGKAPNAWFGALNAAALQGVNNTALNNALSKVNTALGLSATLNGANPLTTAFTAANGNLLDDILEAIAKARQTASLHHADLLALAAGSTFTMPASFNFSTAYAAVKAANGGGATTCTSGQTSMTYDGSGPYQDGQKVCFTTSTTSLAFSGKTLSNPTKNPDVVAPNSAYRFVDGAYTYEVVFTSGALHEINVSEGSKFHGQFAPAASGGTGGTGGNGNLVVEYSAGGIAMAAISVSSVPVPTSQSDFCSDISNDAIVKQIAASGGGTMTIDSCTFANKVGQIKSTVKMTTPIALSVPYVITFTFQ